MASPLTSAAIRALLEPNGTFGATDAVEAASNATPIVITATTHGLSSGDIVQIDSVGGNTDADGIWAIEVVDADDFILLGSVGNGAYTSGGTISLVTPGTGASGFAKNLTVQNLLDILDSLNRIDVDPAETLDAAFPSGGTNP